MYDIKIINDQSQGMLTCSYCAFTGRQYIKDVLVDGQSHLMIIREETELPGAQVGWKLIEFGKSGL